MTILDDLRHFRVPRPRIDVDNVVGLFCTFLLLIISAVMIGKHIGLP